MGKTATEIVNTNWTFDEPFTFEKIQTAAMLVMSRNYGSLIGERDRYKEDAEWQRERVEKLRLSNAALKGVITRLRNRRKR